MIFHLNDGLTINHYTKIVILNRCVHKFGSSLQSQEVPKFAQIKGKAGSKEAISIPEFVKQMDDDVIVLPAVHALSS